jgi:hypothetical protein
VARYPSVMLVTTRRPPSGTFLLEVDLSPPAPPPQVGFPARRAPGVRARGLPGVSLEHGAGGPILAMVARVGRHHLPLMKHHCSSMTTRPHQTKAQGAPWASGTLRVVPPVPCRFRFVSSTKSVLGATATRWTSYQSGNLQRSNRSSEAQFQLGSKNFWLPSRMTQPCKIIKVHR